MNRKNKEGYRFCITCKEEKPLTHEFFYREKSRYKGLSYKLGHTVQNTVPCCRECNTARMDNFSHEEMKIIGEAMREIKTARNESI